MTSFLYTWDYTVDNTTYVTYYTRKSKERRLDTDVRGMGLADWTRIERTFVQ